MAAGLVAKKSHATRLATPKGTFELVTWNMRGATGAGLSTWTTPLQCSGVYCLQECGSPEWVQELKPVQFVGQKTDPVRFGTRHTHTVVHVEWTRSVAGNPRCSIGIVISPGVLKHFGDNLVVSALWAKDPEGGVRPILYVILGNKLLIASVHAPSGGGAGTLAYVDETIGILSSKVGVTAGIVAGDFNTPPPAAAAAAGGAAAAVGAAAGGAAAAPDVKTVAASAATHGKGKLLDYAKSWGGVGLAPAGAGLSGFSDHVAQKYTVTI